jgi:glycosyltransferase involved in cell wall biosynthesis
MRTIIYIGLHASPGTSTTSITLAEKLQLLQKCYNSCKAEGAEVVIVAAATSSAPVEEVRKAVPNIPLHGVWGEFDRQRGEQAIGARILAEALTSKADWIIKVAGDTFHPTPGWVDRLIDLAKSHNVDLVATAHHRPDWVNTQVYTVRPSFLQKTWPGADSDWARIGIEAHWGERIANMGLLAKWYAPPSRPFDADGCQNYVPVDEGITYMHAHCMATASAWKATDTRIKPDLSIKVSIVIPARNEVQTNPNRGNVPLLSDTFTSIAETSAGAPMPECILIDDASDKTLPPCPYPGVLRTIRHSTVAGVDPSRNEGIRVATGDVVGILDGHMRVETQQRVTCDLGIQRLATLAMQKQALVVARCAHLDLPANHNDPGNLCGAVLMPLTHPDTQLSIAWRSQWPPDGIRKINGVLGASYFAPKAIWEKMQYFVESCVGWGFSEEGISLKCAFMDIPIYYCGDVTISHWFRPAGPHPYPVMDYEKWINRARVLKVAFGKECFESEWLPRCKRNYTWQEAYNNLLLHPKLLEEVDRFHAVRVKTDAQVMDEVFHIPLHSPQRGPA